MKKLLYIFVLLFAAANVGCSQSNEAVKTELYVFNIKSNTLESIYLNDNLNSDIRWSKDSKYIYLQSGNEYICYSVNDKKTSKTSKDNFEKNKSEYKEDSKDTNIIQAIKKADSSFNEVILCGVYYSFNKAIFKSSNGSSDLYLFDTKNNEIELLGFGDFWGRSSGDKFVYIIKKDDERGYIPVYETDEFYTFVYDLKAGKTIKVADFLASCYIAPDGYHVVLRPDNANFNI